MECKVLFHPVVVCWCNTHIVSKSDQVIDCSHRVKVWSRNDWKSARQGKKNPKLKNNKRDFPGDPVVNKTICSHCRRYRFNLIFPGRGTKVPSATQCDINHQNERERNKVGYSQDCLFIYFWLCWSFGLCCFYATLFGWGEQGLLFTVVCELLIVVTSPVVKHRL